LGVSKDGILHPRTTRDLDLASLGLESGEAIFTKHPLLVVQWRRCSPLPASKSAAFRGSLLCGC